MAGFRSRLFSTQPSEISLCCNPDTPGLRGGFASAGRPDVADGGVEIVGPVRSENQVVVRIGGGMVGRESGGRRECRGAGALGVSGISPQRCASCRRNGVRHRRVHAR